MEAVSAIGQVLLGLTALIISLINLKILNRLNIVDSMRRVNDKYTELNILELENEDLIPLNHIYSDLKKANAKDHIENHKRTNMLYNHINILEGVFIEMKYKTMKKEHALKLLNWFCPQIINHPQGNNLIRNSGYDDDFVQFCLRFENKPEVNMNVAS